MDKLLMQLTRLAAAFPRDYVPESTVSLYADELADLDGYLLGRILRDAIKSYRNFPTVAEIREDYRAAALQPRERYALPSPEEIPMPEGLRKKWRHLLRRMDDRGREMEAE